MTKDNVPNEIAEMLEFYRTAALRGVRLKYAPLEPPRGHAPSRKTCGSFRSSPWQSERRRAVRET